MHKCWKQLPDDLVDYILQFLPLIKKPLRCTQKIYKKFVDSILCIDDTCIFVMGFCSLIFFICLAAVQFTFPS